MKSRERRARIAELIAGRTIPDQETLRKRLAHSRLRISQATLSRDLKILGAQRQRQPGGGWVYTLPESRPAAATEESFRRRFRTSVTGVRRSQVLVLLFTPPGEAQLIGRLLDQTSLPSVLGTLAGDDTILVVAKNQNAARALEKNFKEILK
ncbi:MAG: arginine repressor [Planctomycetota bacterium]